MNLSNLTSGLVAANYKKAPIAGTGARVYLINYYDIDRENSKPNAQDIIESVKLKNGKNAYVFDSLDNSVLTETALAKGTYYSGWEDDVTLRIFTKNQGAKKFIDDLKMARVVCIVENKDAGTDGNVKFEAHGWDAGLELKECTSTSDYADRIVYTAKLGCSEIAKETSLPKTVFKTSIDATRTSLDGLVSE